MHSERSRDKKSNVWIFASCGSRESRDVFAPMTAWEQKKRMHDNASGTTLNASIKGGLDRRFREFHMGGLDDLVAGFRRKQLDHAEQHLVALGSTRSMVDQDDPQRLGRVTVDLVNLCENARTSEGEPGRLWADCKTNRSNGGLGLYGFHKLGKIPGSFVGSNDGGIREKWKPLLFF
jgi:hypothetical protein